MTQTINTVANTASNLFSAAAALPHPRMRYRVYNSSVAN